MNISVFKNAHSTYPVTVPIQNFLSSKKYLELINQVRAETDKKRRDELKKNLPAATISGTFKKREITGIEYYNGLVCLDFDGKDNPDHTPEQMKQILTEFAETMYAGLSVSGTGVFAIIRTNNDNPERHAEVVDYLGNLIMRLGEIRYDRACKDVCRLRFVSADDNAYWAPDCRALDAQRILEKIDQAKVERPPRPIKVYDRTANRSTHTTRDKVERYLQAIEDSHRDITDDYDQWMKIGFALATEFGADGEVYYHRISQFNPKYDPTKTDEKFQNLLKQGSGRVKIGTFFKICNINGITI